MLDRTLRDAQIARLYAHAGEPMTFGAVPFFGIVTSWQPRETSLDRNLGDDTAVLVKAPRSAFGATPPRQGQHFSAGGKLYRITSLPSVPPSDPSLHFVCTVTSL